MKFGNGNFIGIFDSGIGGISVLNSCISNMPNENYIYFADSLNFPYGNKSKDELTEIGINILSIFSKMNAKETIIACNTMSTSNIELFRETYSDMNIIGTFPDFSCIFKPNTILNEHYISYSKKEGLNISRNKKKLLIIATTATCKSEYLKSLINKCKNLIDIYVEPTDFIVKAVEYDKLNTYEFKDELKNFLKEYEDIDYLQLGCTHFSHASKVLRDILGDKVQMFSGGDIAANIAYNYLLENNMLNNISNTSIKIIDRNLDDTKINLYRKLVNANIENIEFYKTFDDLN